jgi:hypothetical protein
MADVRAFKQAIIADAVQEYNPDTGTVSAYTIVDAVGFNGVKNFKRVRIGVEYGVSVDTAKMMMRELRKANNNAPNITGKFVMEL